MKNKKKYLVLLFLFTALVPGLLAQSSSGQGFGRGNRTFDLRVNCNVKGASIYINGSLRKEKTNAVVELAPGTYSVRITKNGYSEYRNQVTVAQDTTLNVRLEANQARLTVVVNVRNSNLFVDNRAYGGNSPFRLDLEPGRHTIRVTADGYYDYYETVTVNRDSTIRVNLEPVRISVTIVIPDNILKDKRNGYRSVDVYIDGRRQNGLNFELNPGSHTIAVESGGFYIERTYTFDSGENYTIKPVFYLEIDD